MSQLSPFFIDFEGVLGKDGCALHLQVIAGSHIQELRITD